MHFTLSLIVSTLLAVLSGLGIGGGSLLMLWLTLFVKVDYGKARLINLLFFIAPAIISCIACRKELHAHKAIILSISAAGIISSVFFSIISQGWDVHILRKLFGGLLLILGIRELRAK